MKCSLRPWEPSDAPALAAMLSNRKILNNLRDGLPYPYTEQDAAAYIAAMRQADPNQTFAFAITVGGRLAGSIGVFRQGNIHARTAELGYYLAEELWGQGIMTDAIGQICDRVFETTDILRIFAEPFAYNTGSCRALEKAGFVLEGTMRRNAVKNGKVVDMRLYGRTRSAGAVEVKRLAPEELPQALELAWEVFCRFEAPEYSDEGIAEFRHTLENPAWIRRMQFYGAFADGALAGVLAMREPQHVSLFFVRETMQRRGIGSGLFAAMRQDYAAQTFTVNAAPCAVGFYRKLGFTPTDAERLTNGIRYTPMTFAEPIGI